MNIDIHCHSSSKPFHSGFGQQSKDIFTGYQFNIESGIMNIFRETISSAFGLNLYTESNLDRLYEGGVRVAFLSLTPAEKGFTIMNSVSKKNALYDLLLADRGDNRRGYLSNKVLNAVTGYKISDIDRFKYLMTHYYKEYFKEEYQWLIGFDNKTRVVQGRTYSVHFPTNYNELEENLKDDSKLNVILNVEGAHSFGAIPHLQEVKKGHKYTDVDPGQYDGVFTNDITNFIRKEVKKYPVPILSIGLCHHFWNGLAGHARSLNKLLGDIVNQEQGINTGITENGKVVIKDICKSDHFGKKERSIILDIKHMSCRSRKELYALRRNTPELKGTTLICSHTGINVSYPTLDGWIGYLERCPKEPEKRSENGGRYYLHDQSINLCREDLVELYSCAGIIGIQLDNKRIMGELALQEFNKPDANIKYLTAKILWANIFCAMDELDLAKVDDLRKAWDMFCIGSDFDGLINHLKAFPDASHLNALRASMHYFLEEPSEIVLYKEKDHEIKLSLSRMDKLKCGYDNQTLIRKLFSQNALDFLKKNF